MPRRKKRWSKISAWTVVVLGLAAGVTMNLVTAWFQKDIISNAFYLFLVIFLLAAIIYSGRKMRTSEFFFSEKDYSKKLCKLALLSYFLSK